MKRPLAYGRTADITIHLADANATVRLGEEIARLCRGGDVILLAGELGGGKTTMVRGLARGLGVPEEVPVTSPTFGIVHEYPGRLPLFHFDLYRISGEDELYETGFDDYAAAGGVMAVEWPERLGGMRPEAYLLVTLVYTRDFTAREAQLTARGGDWQSRLDRIAPP